MSAFSINILQFSSSNTEMGIIQRQGIKQSLITYFGVLIGAVNVILIYTSTLTPDEYGLIQVMLSTSKIVLPFVLLGSQSMIVRFFPRFDDSARGHNGYLLFLLLIPTIGVFILYLVDWWVQPNLISLFFEPTPLIEMYGAYLIPLLLFLAYAQVFTRYEMNFHRIAIPAIFNDLFVKIGLPLCCIAYYFGWLDFEGALIGIVLLHLVILLAHIIYTKKLGQLFLKPNFSRINKPLIKEMGTYAGFGVLGNLGSAIVPQIDTFMVGSLIGLSSAAIYTIPNFVTNVIDIPRKALANISGPIITKAWEENDREELQGLYSKSSINQFIVGLFMLIGLWISIDDLYALIPNNGNKEIYETGKTVVLILGASKVFDMLTGMNSELIMYSKYFRINFYAIFVLAGVAILLNYILIPIYGIDGAAYATLISFAIFNLLKFLFLLFKENLQPFSLKTIWVALLGLVSYLLICLMPDLGNPILNILIRSSLFTIIYVLAVWQWRLSPELSNMADDAWTRIKGFFNS
ncbi:MAG: polysaccharide biosynthesis protein [Saprospiraceae bacterium]|nr:polysaccharide biosynthesis protein [Saprospiraceae bacterium]